MNQNYLVDEAIRQLLENVDYESAQKCKEEGCQRCGNTLHWDNFGRKPRGGPAHWDKRYSFTCAKNRHRTTPPSVRFLGRKVYISVVVILVTAMKHGLAPQRVSYLKKYLNLDRRTLAHWRKWWLETFVQSAFWKGARARFSPRLCEQSLPLSLCEAFEVERQDRLLELLNFLVPISLGSLRLVQGT
jgi:hypothetical protein